MMLATSGAEFAEDDVNDVVGGFLSWTVYHLYGVEEASKVDDANIV